MRQTEKYKLNLPDGGDRISTKPLNENMEKVEAAILEAMAYGASELTKAVGSGGYNARIAFGSYTGNGRSGEDWPTGLEFDFKPVLVQIMGQDRRELLPPLVRGCTKTVVRVFSADEHDETISVEWGDRSVSWYNEYYGKSDSVQMNESGRKYYWVALGYTEQEGEGDGEA